MAENGFCRNALAIKGEGGRSPGEGVDSAVPAPSFVGNLHLGTGPKEHASPFNDR